MYTMQEPVQGTCDALICRLQKCNKCIFFYFTNVGVLITAFFKKEVTMTLNKAAAHCIKQTMIKKIETTLVDSSKQMKTSGAIL